MKKNKLMYKKPLMQVFELKQMPQLLQASGGDYPQWDPENI